jgi:RNA polymerase sigma-70 factor (ECF subfamily)
MHALYRANAGPLRQYLMRLTHGQRETAEDLVQETMLRAWRRVDALPADEQSQRRWLFTIARNLTIDAARARQARPPEVSADDVTRIPAADDDFVRALDRHVLHDALQRLSPEHRAVLAHLYFHDASVAQVAARIGVPEGTVRSRSFYALRTMRDLLERPGA